ncbi:hypothetical protein RS130_07745 [Paraglaciecola aquimarina]|uniref:Uncharacterized protein n=1 Tax=Paraglaciecola aquimarina TaxID=1235557 RepID=A0ABU3SUZ0_9ALTE|nr:hypothetical protein [Paraglaciecola aquimarina]MDU0353833.1 hypothetical protein [Paraglaciecola aquimarina]
MHSGGVVQINHFALKTNLTRCKIGITFFKAILCFLKSKSAISVEFHENHSSKIERYRRFFKKLEIKESAAGVWRVELYDNDHIPNNVLSFHEELKRSSKA